MIVKNEIPTCSWSLCFLPQTLKEIGCGRLLVRLAAVLLVGHKRQTCIGKFVYKLAHVLWVVCFLYKQFTTNVSKFFGSPYVSRRNIKIYLSLLSRTCLGSWIYAAGGWKCCLAVLLTFEILIISRLELSVKIGMLMPPGLKWNWGEYMLMNALCFVMLMFNSVNDTEIFF